jgi:hypothetical protein
VPALIPVVSPGDEDKLDEMERVLDKEEKEMDKADEEDDEDGENIQRDVDLMEEAMEEAVKQVSKMAKPVRQVLYKVGPIFLFFLTCPFFHLFFLDPIPTFKF